MPLPPPQHHVPSTSRLGRNCSRCLVVPNPCIPRTLSCRQTLSSSRPANQSLSGLKTGPGYPFRILVVVDCPSAIPIAFCDYTRSRPCVESGTQHTAHRSTRHPLHPAPATRRTCIWSLRSLHPWSILCLVHLPVTSDPISPCIAYASSACTRATYFTPYAGQRNRHLARYASAPRSSFPSCDRTPLRTSCLAHLCLFLSKGVN